MSTDGRTGGRGELDEVIWLRRKRDIAGLQHALRASRVATARAEAARSLGKFGDDSVVDALVESLTDESEHVKIAAAQAIAKIGDKEAADSLIRALPNAAAPVTQLWILESLVSLRSQEARSPLAEYLNAEKPRIRLWAAQLLVTLGDEASVKLVDERIKHERGLWRWRMARVARAARK